jgi:hypothetical protein
MSYEIHIYISLLNLDIQMGSCENETYFAACKLLSFTSILAISSPSG